MGGGFVSLVHRGQLCSAAIGTVLVLGALSGGAEPANPSFGIADAPSQCATWGANSCQSWSYGFASYSGGGPNSAFAQLRHNLPLRYVRLFAPYDAVYDANPTTQACRSSYDYASHTSSQYPTGGGPGSAWFRLVQEITDARAVGLTPLIALTNATADDQQQDGVPSTPDPTAASSAGPAATTTLAGADYSCGVQGLTYFLHVKGLPVGEWEAWNEPDGAPVYNGALSNACGAAPNSCAGVYDTGTGLCGSTTYSQCGPLEAAGLYADLANTLSRWNALYGWPIPPLAAGTLSWGSVGYFNAYFKQLTTVIGQWPEYVSFHDYADVTSGGSAQSYNFTNDIFNQFSDAGKPQPSVWISEAGIVLTDGDPSYNYSPITCSNGGADDASRLGACVDGNPSAQQAGATEFLNLASRGSYSQGQISQVFWYQLQPSNASTGWDSGLLAPPAEPGGSWAQASPDGVYGSNLQGTGWRPSLCVLARLTSASCSSSPVEASDWSIQPRTVSGMLVAGQPTVTGIIGDQSSLADGDFVTGPGIPDGTVITGGAGTANWSLSNDALATSIENLTASG
jgi:hypothetical protein